MSYEWPRMYKNEEHFERLIADDVFEHICDWFGVNDVTELTEDQYNEVVSYRETLNEYSVMQYGYSQAICAWEDENLWI